MKQNLNLLSETFVSIVTFGLRFSGGTLWLPWTFGLWFIYENVVPWIICGPNLVIGTIHCSVDILWTRFVSRDKRCSVDILWTKFVIRDKRCSVDIWWTKIGHQKHLLIQWILEIYKKLSPSLDTTIVKTEVKHPGLNNLNKKNRNFLYFLSAKDRKLLGVIIFRKFPIHFLLCLKEPDNEYIF